MQGETTLTLQVDWIKDNSSISLIIHLNFCQVANIINSAWAYAKVYYMWLIGWLTHNFHSLRLVMLWRIRHEHSFLTMPVLTRPILPSPKGLCLLTVITYTSRSPLPVCLKNWSGNSGYQKTSDTTKYLPIILLPVFCCIYLQYDLRFGCDLLMPKLVQSFGVNNNHHVFPC